MVATTTMVKPDRQAEHFSVRGGAWSRQGPRDLEAVVTAFDGRVERIALCQRGEKLDTTDRLTFAGLVALPALIAKVERDEAAAKLPARSAAKPLPAWGKKRLRYRIADGAYAGGAHAKGGAMELVVSVFTGAGAASHVHLSRRVVTRKGALELAALVAEVEAR